jgi:hypothetical protein
MEQRFHAVIECLGGTPEDRGSRPVRGSRQTIRNWLARYASDGIKGLGDQSHRPNCCPHRVDLVAVRPPSWTRPLPLQPGDADECP